MNSCQLKGLKFDYFICSLNYDQRIEKVQKIIFFTRRVWREWILSPESKDVLSSNFVKMM